MNVPKVLMLSRSFTPTGGVAQVLLTFARNYEERRLQLHLCSFRRFAPTMAEMLAQTPAILHEIGDLGYLRPALALRKIVRQQEIDLVVATSLKGYVVAKLAVSLRCNVLYWIHAIALVQDHEWKNAVYRWFARNDTLIFVSDPVRAALSYAQHQGREAVVLNGVEDLSSSPSLRHTQDLRAAIGIPCGAFVVGYTAAFLEWKQHRTLLEAFSLLSEELPELHLVLIGGGDLLPEMQRQAKRGANGERIHFLGPRIDARQLLEIMDVYVHPSDGEAFGLAVVEAMLAQRAIVVSDAGSLPTLIEHGKTGLIFHARSATDLAEKIKALACDSELRQRLGSAGRRAALQRFGAKRFAEELTAVLEDEVMVSNCKEVETV
jgi:glycosyltransferase involved in cell wall biosynthesis